MKKPNVTSSVSVFLCVQESYRWLFGNLCISSMKFFLFILHLRLLHDIICLKIYKEKDAMIYTDEELYMHHKTTIHPEESQFFLHTHTQNEIFCLLRGTGYYTVEGYDYPLSPGCIMIMREGETHTPHISPDGPYERIALHFTTGFVAPVYREFLLSSFFDRPLGHRNYIAPSPRLEKIQNMLLHMVHEPLPEQERRIRIRLYIPTLLYEIANAIQDGGVNVFTHGIICYVLKLSATILLSRENGS